MCVYGCKCVCVCARAGLSWTMNWVCVSLLGGVSVIVVPGCQLPAWRVRGEGRLIPSSADKDPGSGPPLPSARIQRPSRFPSSPPAPPNFPRPPEGLWQRGLGASSARGFAVPGVLAPQAPGSCGSPPPPPLSVPPSLRPSFPPERGLRAGVGGDFAGVSISYLAAKLSFCVSPSCSLQLLLSSEMPGQGKGLRAAGPAGGLRTGRARGHGTGAGAPAGRGRCPDRPLLLSLFMQSFWAPELPQVKVKARAGGGGRRGGWGRDAQARRLLGVAGGDRAPGEGPLKVFPPSSQGEWRYGGGEGCI